MKANIFHRAVITGSLSFPQAGGMCLIYTPWPSGFGVRIGSQHAFWSAEDQVGATAVGIVRWAQGHSGSAHRGPQQSLPTTPLS